MRLLSLSPALGALLLASSVLAQAPTSRPRVTPSGPAPTTPVPSTIAPAPGSAGPLAAGSSTMGYLQGVAVDSIHGTPLVNAIIQISGTDRLGMTDSLGRFLIDSVKPGTYKVEVDHAILDTIGILLSTAPMQFAANEVTRVLIAVPSQEFLAARFCPPARRALGRPHVEHSEHRVTNQTSPVKRPRPRARGEPALAELRGGFRPVPHALRGRCTDAVAEISRLSTQGPASRELPADALQRHDADETFEKEMIFLGNRLTNAAGQSIMH
jgi:hypothetical protein